MQELPIQQQELPAKHDAAVSEWMAKQGWPVTRRNYSDSEVFGWRAEGVRPNITMRITRSVVEDYSPDELTRILDGHRAAQRLAKAPEKYTVLRRSDVGPPELIQLDEPPK